MYAAFVRLLNMSVAGSILIAAIVLLRLVLRRAPKKYLCLLWAIAALRLCCPVSISSAVSAYNYIGSQSSGQVEYIQYNEKSEKPMGELPAFAGAIPSQENPQAQHAFYLPTVMGIWAAGVAVMLAYLVVSSLQLRKQTEEAVRLYKNIYLCDRIPSPFILGVLKPRIYLPSWLDDKQKQSVLPHELAHIRRLDHWWKPIGFLILSVHWFNPMVWLGYSLLCADIEAACDERVISKMSTREKQNYSETLLQCSMSRHTVSACPLAFGETGVKQRIRGIANYRKPTAWIAALSLIICLFAAVVFLTDPVMAEMVGSSAAGTTEISSGDFHFTLPGWAEYRPDADNPGTSGEFLSGGEVIGGLLTFPLEYEAMQDWNWVERLPFPEWEIEYMSCYIDSATFTLEFFSAKEPGQELEVLHLHNLFWQKGTLYDLWFDITKVGRPWQAEVLDSVYTEGAIQAATQAAALDSDTGVRIYSSPSESARLLGTLTLDDTFTVVREESIGNAVWGYGTVESRNIMGWIKLEEEVQTVMGDPDAYFVDMGKDSICVGTITSESPVNIRSGAGVSYPVKGQMQPGDEVTIWQIAAVDDHQWGRLGYDEWILMDYVALDEPVQAKITAQADLRSVPSPGSRTLGTLEAGTEIRLLRTESIAGVDWCYVTTDMLVGWIEAEYIQK